MSLKPNYKLNSLNYIRQITSHKFRTVFSRLECNEVKLFIFRNSELLEERPICLHQPSLFKTVHVHWWLWGFSSFSLLWYYNSNNLGEKKYRLYLLLNFFFNNIVNLSTQSKEKKIQDPPFFPTQIAIAKDFEPKLFRCTLHYLNLLDNNSNFHFGSAK